MCISLAITWKSTKKACSCSYSWSCMWYVHFPPRGRCTPAASSLGMVFPRSAPPRTKTLHCCRSNARLQHRETYNPVYSNFLNTSCNGALLVFPKRGEKNRGKKSKFVLAHSVCCQIFALVSNAVMLPGEDLCISILRVAKCAELHVQDIWVHLESR